MKTEFLKDLLKDVEKESQKTIIDSIMAENGKDIKAVQDKLTTTEADRDNYKGQLETAQEALKGFEGVDVKELKEKIDTLNADLKQKDDDHKAEVEALTYKTAVDNYLNSSDYKFSSGLAKDAVKAKLIDKNFKIENDKLLGADDFIKELKESDPDVFKSEEPIDNPTAPIGGAPAGKSTDSMRAAFGLPQQEEGEK